MAASCNAFRRIFAPILSQYRVVTTSIRSLSNGDKIQESKTASFDEKLLEILVCPLTKKPLRYNAASNQLISDEIGVAYPIKNGIPNLIPTDGQILNKQTSYKE